MFGDKTKRLHSLVERRQWNKIHKLLERADGETKIKVAQACDGATDSEALNLLVLLMMDAEEPVQLAAIEVLGRVGDDSVVTRMRWLLGKTPEEKKGLKDALHHAILGIEQRK